MTCTSIAGLIGPIYYTGQVNINMKITNAHVKHKMYICYLQWCWKLQDE